MAQISLLSGITSDMTADWRTSYPVNLVPTPKDTGISKGYLLSAPGIERFGTGPGVDRGALVAGGILYRVMGSRLLRVFGDGSTQDLGDVGGSGQVSMDYSFSRFCVVSGGNAYLYLATLDQITDPDIGHPIDVVWMDGYFVFTDGQYIYVTDLNDPYSIDPDKYAGSEIDPDPITGLLKWQNELYVCNRFTIEVFDNVGGEGFPFQRTPGGLISKGVVGTHAKCLYDKTFAWVGSARNEPCSVYLQSGGQPVKIATREVEERIQRYSEEQLATVLVEAKAERMHQHLIVHLPDETLVYDGTASAAVGEPVWFNLSTGVSGVNPYRAKNFQYAYGRWIVGDKEDGRIGVIDDTVSTQYGEIAGWQFDTMMLYNEGRGGIVHELELTGTLGRAPFGDNDEVCWSSYTLDGLVWSEERAARMGPRGRTQQRVVWRRAGHLHNFRGQRFRGANSVPIAWTRLEAQLEPLYA